MGGFFKAGGDLLAGWEKSQADKFNADVAARNAQMASQQASDEATMQQMSAAQSLGAARAAYGASGVTMEGSPTAVLAHSASMAELDKQSLIYKGRLRSQGLNAEAAADRQAATAALVGGVFKAGGDFGDSMAKASAAGGK